MGKAGSASDPGTAVWHGEYLSGNTQTIVPTTSANHNWYDLGSAFPVGLDVTDEKLYHLTGVAYIGHVGAGPGFTYDLDLYFRHAFINASSGLSPSAATFSDVPLHEHIFVSGSGVGGLNNVISGTNGTFTVFEYSWFGGQSVDREDLMLLGFGWKSKSITPNTGVPWYINWNLRVDG